MVKIRVEKVRYGYPHSGCDVLKGISSEFPEGNVTAILGANGSGKTTLFKVILKIFNPREGTVHVNGGNIGELGRDALSKYIAWVPQDEGFSFPYTILEYLLMGRTPHLGFFGLPTKTDVAIIKEILDELEISSLSNRNIVSLSGGENRLVSIARALAQEPEVLLLDEPTGHLDLGNKAKILDVIGKMADLGKTVIFSTHDPNEALLIADNVVIINDGKTLCCGVPCEVITEYVLKKVYGTEVMLIKVNGKPMVSLDHVSSI